MRRRSWLIAVLAGMLLGIGAPAAHAYSVTSWTAGVYGGDYTGPSDKDFYTQAGGHPFEGVTDFTLATSGSTTQSVRVDLPPGLVSNPQGIPQCSDAQFPACPSDTQLGIVKLSASLSGVTSYIGASVYNMVPAANQVSDFAFDTVAGRTDIIGGIRSASDDGLFFTIAAPSSVTLLSSTLIFWGVPGDSAHDPQRGWSCLSAVVDLCSPPASATTHDLSGEPFISLPSGCVTAGQVTTLTVDSVAGEQAKANSVTPVPATGCAKVPFAPTVTLTPQTTEADSPTGVSVDLHVPQNENPGRARELRPRGRIGHAAAGDDARSVGRDGAAGVQPDPIQPWLGRGAGLPGRVANRHRRDRHAPAGESPEGIGLPRLRRPLGADPVSRQHRARQPLHLRGGSGSHAEAGRHRPRKRPDGPADDRVRRPAAGPVQRPQARLRRRPGRTDRQPAHVRCGDHDELADPVLGRRGGDAEHQLQGRFKRRRRSCPQPIPFAPTFSVTPATTRAGAFDSPLTFEFARADREQYLDQISSKLPPGLLGLISRVPQCAAAAAAAGGCPAASRIGTADVLASAGSSPITQTGAVFLTGPYAGAPFGLAIVIPAIAGPFDLGSVIVRAAIEVDKTTAQLTIASARCRRSSAGSRCEFAASA